MRSETLPVSCRPLRGVMPLRLAFSLLNINNMDIQGNPQLHITGNGGSYTLQINNSAHAQATPACRPVHHNADVQPFSTSVIDRRVETQLRIRRKLDEACGRPGSVYGIDIVAQIAKDILSVIEV